MPYVPTEKTRLYLEHRDGMSQKHSLPITNHPWQQHYNSAGSRRQLHNISSEYEEEGSMCGGPSNMWGLAEAKLTDPVSPDNLESQDSQWVKYISLRK